MRDRRTITGAIHRIRLPALAAAALVLSGCATYSDRAAQSIELFRQGRDENAIALYKDQQSGLDRQLNRVELGRFHLLAGQLAESRRQFGSAIDGAIEREEGPVIRIRDVGSDLLSSTIVDDTMRGYQLPGYEAVMALQQKALADLFAGDFPAAAVEARRSAYAQDSLAEKKGKELDAEARRAATEQASAMSQLDRGTAAMKPTLDRARSSFLNAYAWYFAGLLYEAQLDPGNAYVAYKKALTLAPENPHVRRDVLRLSAVQHPGEYAEFLGKFGPQPAEPAGAVQVFVLIEDGWISRRESLKFPLPVGYSWQTLTFPVYQDAPYQPATFAIDVDGRAQGEAAPLCFLQSLAYHDLKERMPGVLFRNITRATARGVAQKQLMDSKHDEANIAGFIWQIANMELDEADTRAWYTLPMVAQLHRTSVAPGAHKLRIANRGGRTLEAAFEAKAGDFVIVWVADLGTRAVMRVVPLHPGPVPAVFVSKGQGEPR